VWRRLEAMIYLPAPTTPKEAAGVTWGNPTPRPRLTIPTHEAPCCVAKLAKPVSFGGQGDVDVQEADVRQKQQQIFVQHTAKTQLDLS
jgi:hypothetical protein